MRDARWPLLKKLLIADGWTWDEDDLSLHAPKSTMWFKQNSDTPNYAEFRDRMSETLENVDQGDLHSDLVSLVGALDAVLRGN